MVLDPLDGRVRELTTPRYRPPAAMADLVRAEQPECSMPGCSQPADDCDLDHLLPWPVGSTCVDGLGPLCRRHHLLRTHAGWTFTMAAGTRGLAESANVDVAGVGSDDPGASGVSSDGLDPGGDNSDGWPPDELCADAASRQAALAGRGHRALTRTWTTAAGHTYTEHPDGALTHGSRQAAGRAGGASGWPHLDEPPPY